MWLNARYHQCTMVAQSSQEIFKNELALIGSCIWLIHMADQNCRIEPSLINTGEHEKFGYPNRN